MNMELTKCTQVCPYNTLRGCIKDEANGGVCILVKTAVKPISNRAEKRCTAK